MRPTLGTDYLQLTFFRPNCPNS